MNLRSLAIHRATTSILFACLLLTLCAAPAAAGWRELLPIYGGPANRIVEDTAGTLYVATPGGLFRSTDAGATWSPANGDLPAPAEYRILADPVTPGMVYASVPQGLYRTADGGDTWTRLPLDLTGGATINRFVVAATNPDYIFVATRGSYVHRSLDGGATWEQRWSGLSGGWGGPSYIDAIAVDPTNENRVYTTTWRGYLFRSEDAATTWTRVGGSGTWALRDNLLIAPSSTNVLYATQDEYWFGQGTVLRSSDYGNSWSAMSRPTGVAGDAGQMGIDATDHDVVYVTTSQGIYKTTSGGASWTQVFYPPAGPIQMQSVAVSAVDPLRVFAGSYYSGFYRSLDAGGAWAQNNTGIAATQFSGFDLCRDFPGTMYAAVSAMGYLKTSDGGETWGLVGTGMGFESHTLGSVAVHPEDPDVMVTGSNDGAPRTWRTVDGGASFALTHSTYRAGNFRFNPQAPNYVHGSVSDSQGGFVRSSDSGASWAVPYSRYIYTRRVDFHPDYPNLVFTGANQYTGAPVSTLYVLWSNNYGSPWQTPPSIGQGDVHAVALDQNDPETLYVAGRLSNEGTQGVYKFTIAYSGSTVVSATRVPGTFNNGITNTEVRGLLYDSAGGRLFAVSTNDIYVSYDQAATWASITDGLPHNPTPLMAVTPDGSRLIVATRGGVWEYTEGPAGCADPGDVDYRGYTAGDCASSVVKAKNQATLDAYLADFGVGGGTKPKHLNVLFNPATDDLQIVSPCRVKLLGTSKLIDLAAERVCVYGRGGVTVGAGTPAPGSLIDAGEGEIMLVSEEGAVQTQPGIAFLAGAMTLEAAADAEIGSTSTLDVVGLLRMTSRDGAALVQPGSDLLLDDLEMAAPQGVLIRDHATVAVENDLRLSSTSSGAEIQAGSQVRVTGNLAVSGLSAKIGAGAEVEVAGTATLAAAGSATASDAEILSNATLIAADVSQTAEHKVMISGGALVDAGTGHCEMDAGDPSLCVIHGTVTGGTMSGNCMP